MANTSTPEVKPETIEQSDAEESQLTRVSHTVMEQLPDKRHLAYYAGLAGLAAFGVMSWPIAAAIGVGVWLGEPRQR